MATRNQIAGGIATGGIGIIAYILTGLYGREGGYVDHPNDRGGKTRYGITEQVARQWGYTGHMRDFPKHCTPSAPVCADRIYTVTYIERPGFKPMAAIEPAVLDELVDTGVLSGPPVAAQFFQTALNVRCNAGITVDKKVGPRTIAAYRDCQRRYGKVVACVTVLNGMDAMQEDFFRRIVERRPSQRVFLKGWINHRVGNVDRRRCGQGVA